MTHEIEAVLLDVDGTLIDSNDAHARAWVAAVAERGYATAFEDVRWLIGMGGDRVLPRLTGLPEESAEGRRIVERRGEIFRERYLPELQPFPQVRELLERLRAAGRRLVVATSASADDLDALLERAGIADVIHGSTNSDEAEESKPAPDIVAAALSRSRAAPERAVMLGDTPYDVEAALRAGVRCIALRCGGWDDPALRGAVEIHDDAAALVAAYERSLIGR